MTKATSEVTCAYDNCDNSGDGYDDGENFERERYGHHGPATKCLACGRTF